MGVNKYMRGIVDVVSGLWDVSDFINDRLGHLFQKDTQVPSPSHYLIRVHVV